MESNLLKINAIKREQVKNCIDIVKQNKDIRRLIIFGSSVTDRCREDSDVDMCLDFTCGIEDMGLFKVLGLLGKACDSNCDILPYGLLSGRIKDEIDSKGVVVYELS